MRYAPFYAAAGVLMITPYYAMLRYIEPPCHASPKAAAASHAR